MDNNNSNRSDSRRGEMLVDLLSLSHVPRWTTFPVARPQSVAEHSYRVAIIAYYLGSYIFTFGSGSGEPNFHVLITWSLFHDGPESKTSDLPSPLKQMIGKSQVRQLEMESCPWVERFEPPTHSIDYKLVQIADSLEALSWLTRYGDAFRDRWDGKNVCDKLRNNILKYTEEAELSWPKSKVREGVREVANVLDLQIPTLGILVVQQAVTSPQK